MSEDVEKWSEVNRKIDTIKHVVSEGLFPESKIYDIKFMPDTAWYWGIHTWHENVVNLFLNSQRLIPKFKDRKLLDIITPYCPGQSLIGFADVINSSRFKDIHPDIDIRTHHGFYNGDFILICNLDSIALSVHHEIILYDTESYNRRYRRNG